MTEKRAKEEEDPILLSVSGFRFQFSPKDGESGWSSLHRAFHFGHLVAASAVGNLHKTAVTEVFSWGSGAKYGNAHIQKLPCKVDSLQGSFVKLVSAEKFHSVAVGTRGEVYTWGFGRGGRLGHPDFDIYRSYIMGDHEVGNDVDGIPKVRMMFDTKEKAYEFYNN
ncbi:hypothetical protein NE237_030643 [Protea cynaroides]|uniref:Uncharacterized protein n=1 Tax=Protea cynaroides TaxID=273540 RepID=A0A9Q0GTF1_9MAGN|nr:hypothetical protein NE237_030643 [Protea cynaroides]